MRFRVGAAGAEEVAELMTSLRRAGLAEDRPFDVVIRGNASAAWPEPKPVDLGALAEAGATWWMEALMHPRPARDVPRGCRRGAASGVAPVHGVA